MGPLQGLRIIEMGGIGPGPFCGMLLADMGADVVCVERTAPPLMDPKTDIMRRGKRTITLNLKQEGDRETLLRLVERADALFEGFRPGVMEKLGLGPEECLARNPRLVYGRMTGWGQSGPLASAAGHDINYISLTGALHATGPRGGKPVPPVPPAGDFGGGAMFLVFGLACALLEAQKSGQGQVVDTAMTDGTALLMALFHSMDAQGAWVQRRGSNLLDGGAHFYGAYETSDGKYVSLGAIEPQFYAELIRIAKLDPADFEQQMDRRRWPELQAKLEALFKTRTRDEWCDLMEGTDTCFAPVLNLHEAPDHPHNKARGTYIEVSGMVQPGPAPRFSRTVPQVKHPPHDPGADTQEVLKDWGIS
jgi:alpha-methylacyl-CoA racemase